MSSNHSQTLSNKIDLSTIADQLSLALTDTNSERTIEVHGLHIGLTNEAVTEFFKNLFSEGSKILRVASGLAIAKGLTAVTEIEIKQAEQMYTQELDRYLPDVSW